MAHIEIHGYAIVSDDDRIADHEGRTPDALRNAADWAYFQAELDRASLTVLGRLGHEANPNLRRRRRLVLTSKAKRLERQQHVWWWNPERLAWRYAAETLLPQGGRVAVPGGRRVFDLFLDIGYDAFHLSRAKGVSLPGGTALFAECAAGRSADDVLASRGLAAAEERVLDPSSPVALTIWRRASQPRD
jgi:dihydrofolate reductase